jgi:hypothetical protein
MNIQTQLALAGHLMKRASTMPAAAPAPTTTKAPSHVSLPTMQSLIVTPYQHMWRALSDRLKPAAPVPQADPAETYGNPSGKKRLPMSDFRGPKIPGVVDL